ncbi:MAG: MarR family winged helix-turn-helix transcriptional regulator [Acetobacteraceae bacterium]
MPSCTCFAVRRAARQITQAYDRSLAPTGLRTTQFSLLNRLTHSGPRSIRKLAQDMGMDRTTLGRNLRPLERDGLVAIGIDPADRRGRALQLTPLGAERLHEARGYWQDAQARFVETFGLERTRALHAALDAVAGLEIGGPPA